MANNPFNKKLFKIAGVSLFVLCTGMVHAQDNGGGSKDQEPDTKAQKEQMARQKEQEKRAKKAQDEALKAHMKHQTKEVRKRMKEDAHKADLYNEHKREFFLKRWFSKKKKH